MEGAGTIHRTGGLFLPRLSTTLLDLRRLLFGSRPRIIFALWLFFIILLELRNLLYGNSHDRVVALSLFTCASCTVAIWACRDLLIVRVKKWMASPRTKFIIIGSLGAAWVEYVFWQFERIFGITGVAANPNLAIDLLATMPWYIMMVALLWRVQSRHGYSFAELFVLGGIYELGADGIVGSLMGKAFTIWTLPVITVLIPMFSLAYSFMVIPCSAIMKDDLDGVRAASSPTRVNRYLYSLIPLFGLSPYFALAILIMVA